MILALNLQPTVLISDVLLFVLLAAVGVYVWRVSRSENARATWRGVFASRMGRWAAWVMVFFVSVGVLDSLHFRTAVETPAGQAQQYSGEVLSVLDAVLTPLRMAGEKTYSAPFSTTLLVKESVTLADGSVARLAPEIAHIHPLGTDKVGQDVLYLALKSVRTGLLIGTLTTLIMLPFACALGIVAGYFGGWVDDVIQYLYTTLNSIPGVLLIAAAVLVVDVQIDAHAEWFNSAAARADLRLLALCAILGLTGWTGLARLLRAETLKLRELDYIHAARALGVSHARILARHVLPNVAHLVIITVVLDFSGLVLAEAVLSYVGAGVDPATPSFGNMINAARLELAREPVVWWPLATAFVFLFALVLAANLFADAVRAAFDPRSARG